MARRCYELKLGKKTYKLRLTLHGQKELKQTDPEAPMLAIIMGAVDDPEAMDNLLTQALSWDGNENSTHSGEDLYDEMVDSGMAGSEDMLKVVMGIAGNAGLLSDAEMKKVERVVRRQIEAGMEMLEQEAEPELPEEDPENPTTLRTLDS